MKLFSLRKQKHSVQKADFRPAEEKKTLSSRKSQQTKRLLFLSLLGLSLLATLVGAQALYFNSQDSSANTSSGTNNTLKTPGHKLQPLQSPSGTPAASSTQKSKENQASVTVDSSGNNAKVNVEINGKKQKLSTDGSLEKSFTSDDGSTSVKVKINQDNNSSSSSVRVQSNSESHSNADTADKDRYGRFDTSRRDH